MSFFDVLLGLEPEGSGRSSKQQENRPCIEVSVIRAKGLQLSNAHKRAETKPNPYCQVSFGREEKNTPVVRGNVNPQWCSTFIFEYMPTYFLTFSIWDSNILAMDTPLGIYLNISYPYTNTCVLLVCLSHCHRHITYTNTLLQAQS